VRNLERKIERLMQQLALQYVSTKEQSKAPTETSTPDSSPKPDASKAPNEIPVSKETDTVQPQAEGIGSKLPPVQDWNKVQIQPADLFGYLGKPRYSQVRFERSRYFLFFTLVGFQDTIYESSGKPLPVGVVMGLAWNPLGTIVTLAFSVRT
jgi:ATP-dependent Lon protease